MGQIHSENKKKTVVKFASANQYADLSGCVSSKHTTPSITSEQLSGEVKQSASLIYNSDPPIGMLLLRISHRDAIKLGLIWTDSHSHPLPVVIDLDRYSVHDPASCGF